MALKFPKTSKVVEDGRPSALDLSALRQSLGLSQTAMGERMGLSMRGYQDLEADPSKLKTRHEKLANYVALEVAHERREPMLAPPAVRAMALDLAAMLRGDKA